MSNPTELPDLDRADVRALALVNKIADLFHIGTMARDETTILANLHSVMRRADCLSAIEREFFMVPGEIDEDYPDLTPEHECLLSWGHSPDLYVEQFRKALARRAQPQGEAPQGSIGDYAKFHMELDWYDNEASYGSINEARNRLAAYIDSWLYRHAPAATLSPLCGAQHAESGKEVGPMPTSSLEDCPKDEQEWAKVDPAVAFHLIERHAEDWADAGRLMLQWHNAMSRAAQLDGGQEGSESNG